MDTTYLLQNHSPKLQTYLLYILYLVQSSPVALNLMVRQEDMD